MALSPWVRPIAYCEQDRYCQAVLMSRMSESIIPMAPIWDDVTTLVPELLPRQGVDIIYGGFPCQDISSAGNGEGLGGERSALYWHIHRLAKEIHPPWIFLENVPAIRTRGLLTVVRSLADLGYDSRWTRISAAEIGANHIRERWFLLGYSKVNYGSQLNRDVAKANGIEDRQKIINQKASRQSSDAGEQSSILANAHGCGELQSQGSEQEQRRWIGDDGTNVSNPNSEFLREQSRGRIWQNRQGSSFSPDYCQAEWWKVEPNVGRVVDGLPFRPHRIKGLGNSVVPAQVKEAFERLMGLK